MYDPPLGLFEHLDQFGPPPLFPSSELAVNVANLLNRLDAEGRSPLRALMAVAQEARETDQALEEFGETGEQQRMDDAEFDGMFEIGPAEPVPLTAVAEGERVAKVTLPRAHSDRVVTTEGPPTSEGAPPSPVVADPAPRSAQISATPQAPTKKRKGGRISDDPDVIEHVARLEAKAQSLAESLRHAHREENKYKHEISELRGQYAQRVAEIRALKEGQQAVDSGKEQLQKELQQVTQQRDMFRENCYAQLARANNLQLMLQQCGLFPQPAPMAAFMPQGGNGCMSDCADLSFHSSQSEQPHPALQQASQHFNHGQQRSGVKRGGRR